jgi:hypothetical protein
LIQNVANISSHNQPLYLQIPPKNARFLRTAGLQLPLANQPTIRDSNGYTESAGCATAHAIVPTF